MCDMFVTLNCSYNFFIIDCCVLALAYYKIHMLVNMPWFSVDFSAAHN